MCGCVVLQVLFVRSSEVTLRAAECHSILVSCHVVFETIAPVCGVGTLITFKLIQSRVLRQMGPKLLSFGGSVGALCA